MQITRNRGAAVAGGVVALGLLASQVLAPAPPAGAQGYGLESDVLLLIEDLCERKPQHPRCVPTPSASGSPSPTPSLSPSASVAPTPSPTAPPTPSPVVTPPPTPSGSAVACSVTVPSGGSIQTAINGAPANATICLSGSYTSASEIRPRSGQTIRGPATVRSTAAAGSNVRIFSLHQVSNVTLRDLTLVGYHPRPGTFEFGPEHGHGVGTNAATNIRLERLRIENVQGDCIYLDHWGTAMSRDIVITDLDCRNNGRMGIAVVAGENVTATNSLFHNMAWSALNCEPEWYSGTIQGCINVKWLGGRHTGWLGSGTGNAVSITNNTQFAFIGTPHQQGTTAPVVRDIVVADFTVAATANRGMWVKVDGNGYRVRNVTVRNVRGEGQVAAGYIGSPVWLVRVDGATVTDNHQDVTGATTRFVGGSSNTAITATGNTGSGITAQK